MKLDSVVFVTANKGKYKEARKIIPSLQQQDIQLAEIQELDPRKIIEAKLVSLCQWHPGEYIVEDTSLYLDCLGNFPGPLIKWFWQGIRENGKGIYELACRFSNFKAHCTIFVGYINRNKEPRYFESSMGGTIVAPRGDNGFGWDPIFVANGFSKTFAEMSADEKNAISMRKKVFEQLKYFLEIQEILRKGEQQDET